MIDLVPIIPKIFLQWIFRNNSLTHIFSHYNKKYLPYSVWLYLLNKFFTGIENHFPGTFEASIMAIASSACSSASWFAASNASSFSGWKIVRDYTINTRIGFDNPKFKPEKLVFGRWFRTLLAKHLYMYNFHSYFLFSALPVEVETRQF